METQTITTRDGVSLTFDVVGSGPPLILLHGMGYTRKNWHEVGWSERLAEHFKVIALDTRGEAGDSGKPTDPAAYTIDRMCADILEVANACMHNTLCCVVFLMVAISVAFWPQDRTESLNLSCWGLILALLLLGIFADGLRNLSNIGRRYLKHSATAPWISPLYLRRIGKIWRRKI